MKDVEIRTWFKQIQDDLDLLTLRSYPPGCECDKGKSGWAVGCPMHGADKPAPEPKCSCVRGRREWWDSNCPIHGHLTDPALPLRAQVAKALGNNVHQEGCTGNWFMGDRRTSSECPQIPPYDTDIAKAMGALEEYCEKNGLGLNAIEYFPHSGDKNHRWSVKVGVAYNFELGGSNSTYANSLPEAICQAIVKHKEGK